jgi:chemosensory pili system protein ChpA (sensor histidine kinase/response regulator)
MLRATPVRAAPSPASEPVGGDLLPPPQDELDAQLLPIFLEEAGELFTTLHATLRAWRVAPEATPHPITIARLLHSLKGSARMAGAMSLGAHLHQLESRLEDGVSAVEPAATLVDALALGLDRCEQMIDALALGDSGEASATGDEPTAAAPAEAAHGEETEALSSPTLRVRAELVDRFVNQAGEIGVARSRINGELRTLRRSLLELTENVIRLRSQLREVEIFSPSRFRNSLAGTFSGRM